MKKRFAIVIVAVLCACCLGLAACGSGGSGSTAASSSASGSASASAAVSGSADASSPDDALKNMRKLSWEGDELTVTVGTNKTTGCEWKTKFEDDSIIGYSVNRVFHLSDASYKTGDAIGTSDIGYKGKGAGTTKIFLSTEKDWEGNEPGYSYTVTVTVNEDGTIVDATGE